MYKVGFSLKNMLSHDADFVVSLRLSASCATLMYFLNIIFNDILLFAVFLIGQCDGKKFIERDAKFTLGEGCEISIVDGVEEALKSMKSGEQAKLKVQSRYGFGSEGHERYGVPSNADLEYEVHLKSYFPVNSCVG
jgi:hypothetical protein